MPVTMLRRTAVLSTLCLMLAISQGTPAAPQPTVVELFTSQGCSSCPPADVLLGELTDRPNVVALAYHVDYWDDLGWRDDFALPTAAQRQREYGRVLGLRTVFTPQAIVNGRHSILGSDRRALLAAIRETSEKVGWHAGISAGQLSVDLQPLAEPASYDLLIVSYRSSATTRVVRGENAGRTLQQYNIVRSSLALPTWRGEARRYSIPVDSLPADADGVAVLLQKPGTGYIAGAVKLTLR